MANRKQVLERIIVASGNQLLKNNGVLAGQTPSIYNMATKNYTLVDGQIGIVYMDMQRPELKDVLIHNVASVNDLLTRKIEIVQGTPYSQTPATAQNAIGVNDTQRPRVIRSGIIDTTKPIRTIGTGVLSKWERLSAVRMSGIVPVSNSRYKYHIKVSGKSLAKVNGEQNLDNMSIAINTPDLTGVVNPTDYVYKYLGYKAAQSSAIYDNPISGTGGNSPYMVFGVCNGAVTTPTTLVPVGYTIPLVSDIIAGVVTSIVHTSIVNPNTGIAYPLRYTVDEAFRQMLIESIANGQLLATDRIGVLNVSQAGTSATVNVLKGLLFVGMKTATYEVQDEEGDDKICKIEVTADRANELNSPLATLITASRRSTSEGKGERYIVRYKEDAANDVYSRQSWGSNFDLFPKYTAMQVGKWYTVYEFESELHETEYNNNNYSVGEVVIVRTVLLVESSAPNAATTTPGITNANEKAGLTTYLAPILNTVPTKLNYSTFTFN